MFWQVWPLYRKDEKHCCKEPRPVVMMEDPSSMYEQCFTLVQKYYKVTTDIWW